MGAITWTAPAALWLLLLVPVVYLAHRLARTNFNPNQGRLQAALRSLLLALLVLALARPDRVDADRRGSRSSTRSTCRIASAVRRSPTRRAGSTRSTPRCKPAHSRIVIFGSTVRTVADTAALRRSRSSIRRPPIRPTSIGAAPISKPRWTRRAAELASGPHSAHRPLQRRPVHGGGRARGDRPARRPRAFPVSVEPLAVRSLERYLGGLDRDARADSRDRAVSR